MYGGAHGLTVSCLLSLQKHLMSVGHTVITDIVANGSILPKVRNGIVKRFIDGDADVLLFIDSDMLFEPRDIEKLINAPFDISVINYRTKNNAIKWLAVPIDDAGEWREVALAGTGIMAIKREAVEKMVVAYPASYSDNGVMTPCLFDFVLDDSKYYGEDYVFCKKFTDIGGKIYMLADAYTGHIGNTVYGGNYADS